MFEQDERRKLLSAEERRLFEGKKMQMKEWILAQAKLSCRV